MSDNIVSLRSRRLNPMVARIAAALEYNHGLVGLNFVALAKSALIASKSTEAADVDEDWALAASKEFARDGVGADPVMLLEIADHKIEWALR